MRVNNMKNKRTSNTVILSITAIVAAGLMLTATTNFSAATSTNNQSFDPATQVEAGRNVSAALSETGTVYTRGQNTYGQLGLGDFSNRKGWTPVPLEKKVSDISTGNTHMVVKAEDETIYTWGDNRTAITGQNSSQNSAAQPTQVVANYRFNDVALSEDFAVGINDTGKIFRWGIASDNEEITGPQPIAVDETFTTIKAGKDFILALDNEGHLWGLGNNDYGQLGNGTNEPLNELTETNSSILFDSIEASPFSNTVIGVSITGILYTWGSNEHGQLGIGTDWRLEQVLENERVAAEIDAIQSADQQRRSALIQQCISIREEEWEEEQDVLDREAARKAREEKEKAEEEEEEATPSPTSTPRPTATSTPKPTPTPTPTPTRTRPSMPDFSDECAAEVDETFQVTDTSDLKPAIISEPDLQPDANVPTEVPSIVNFVSATTGSQNSYAIDVLGRLYSWGADRNGQNGNNIDDPASHTQVPLRVDSQASDWIKVAAGDRWAVAVAESGSVQTWGLNTHNILSSDEAKLLIPTEINSGFVDVYAGKYTGFAVHSNGELNTWGSGETSLLGTESTSNRNQFMPVGKLDSVTVNTTTVIALSDDKRLHAWGSNDKGLFSNGTSEEIQLPPQEQKVSQFSAAKAGKGFTVALDNAGNVWHWGERKPEDIYTSWNLPYPTILGLPSKIKLIDAGGTFGFAVSEDNILYYWDNAYSVGSIQVEADIVNIVAGDSHVLMQDTEGHLWNWGSRSAATLNTTPEEPLAAVTPEQTYTAIAAAGQQSYAITTEGVLLGWGETHPALLTGLSDEAGIHTLMENVPFATITASENHLLGTGDKGNIYGWGEEPYGTFGDLSYSTTMLTLPVTIGDTN